MQFQTPTLAESKASLSKLISSLEKRSYDKNEAETRFHIIDVILEKCLGWPKELTHVEISQDLQYTDYELGEPRQAIWEAKREGVHFELPANPDGKLIVDLPSLQLLSKNTSKAIEQVQTYCSRRGVQLAVICNGHQLIAFLATRFDGKVPTQGNAIVLTSLTHFLKEFEKAWQYLSYNGVREKRIVRLLSTGQSGVPLKLSTKLINYPKIRFQSQTHSTLRQVAELVIQDIIESSLIEEQFFKSCYCESGALSQHALVSKNILNARYASMFSDSEPHPQTSPVTSKGKKKEFTPEIMAEALSQRPIVLIGDVGVGKTSFVKNLKYTTAYKEFKNALYIYIDLGAKASLSNSLKDFILTEIETQIYEKYKIEISHKDFIKNVYKDEIRKFENGIYSDYKDTDPSKYNEKLLEHLEKILSEKDRHIKKSIKFISISQQKQTIICIDNADQRTFEIQQDAFIIAQELAKDWSATVFLSVRPQTFYKSKQSGALTAYPHKVFTISPPRVDDVIEKRLLFALSMAKGDIPVETLKGININIQNLVYFLQALLYSLKNNKDLIEMLSNITGGNIRAAVEFVTNFIGSPNVDAEKIIRIIESEGYYTIPVHEFSKSALLGDYSHYNPESSLAMNIFDVKYGDIKEHFLVGMILGFLDNGENHKDRDGFINTNTVVSEFQTHGFTIQQTETALRRMTNKKTIETSLRLTFDEDETGLIGEMPSKFRITTIGAYHIKRWVYSFAYLDAMVFDTPIFDDQLVASIVGSLESYSIEDRYSRACGFREYLLSTWSSSSLSPRYFDLHTIIKQGTQSFQAIERVVQKNKFLSNGNMTNCH
ncbi:MAG: hypothetical protein PHI97_18715 [Desulfobulbus sp.]|nr:hypothetical protein [Desulfobulbus sp.]